MSELCNFLSVLINVLNAHSTLRMMSVLLFKVTKSHINKSSALILDNALIYLYYQVHFCELPVETFLSVTSED